jgi:S-adenosylmethionine synthetase
MGSRRWLGAHLHALDAAANVCIHPLVHPGSVELLELAGRPRSGGAPLANDTSCGVGYAPLSSLGRAVLQVERALNAPDEKRRHPEIGEDVKVMGVRSHGEIDLTVACAIVDRFVRGPDEYRVAMEHVRQLATDTAREIVGREVSVRSMPPTIPRATAST